MASVSDYLTAKLRMVSRGTYWLSPYIMNKIRAFFLVVSAFLAATSFLLSASATAQENQVYNDKIHLDELTANRLAKAVLAAVPGNLPNNDFVVFASNGKLHSISHTELVDFAAKISTLKEATDTLETILLYASFAVYAAAALIVGRLIQPAPPTPTQS